MLMTMAAIAETSEKAITSRSLSTCLCDVIFVMAVSQSLEGWKHFSKGKNAF